MHSGFILGDGDQLDALATYAHMIVMSASRASIEACRTGDFVDRLMRLSDSREHTHRFANAIVLHVDGFDDDPRELTVIPEVVAFFRKVADAWPYAFHFLSTDTESLQLYLHFLIPLEPIHGGDPNRVLHLVDAGELAGLAEQHYRAMDLLHEQHDVPPMQRLTMKQRIAELLDQHGKEA